MSARRAAAAAMLLLGAEAWVPTCLWQALPQTPECAGGLRRVQQLFEGHPEDAGAISMLWSMPAPWEGASAGQFPPGAARTDGLGASITFAWSPALCDALLPKFDEDIWFASLVTCGSLKAAMTRAFASWSAHHDALSFHDVSAQCTADHLVARGCDLAELWVTNDHESIAGAEVAATTSPTYVLQTPPNKPFVHTNGVAASARGVGVGVDLEVVRPRHRASPETVQTV